MSGPFELTIAEGRTELIHSAQDLETIVAKLGTEFSFPLIVTFENVRGYHVGFCVAAESFVQIALASGEGDYWITVGDREAEGGTDYWLHEIHHTEIPRRNLIPMSRALAVVQEFVFRGTRSRLVAWETL